MKLIFLDIDGVLALNHQNRDEYGSLFHENFIDNLKFIIENTKAKIVISSTWRASGILALKEMWKKRNLPGEIIGVTPLSNLRYRGHEIESYLDNVCKFKRINYSQVLQQTYIETSICKNYIILDDDSDMLLGQKEHFIKCSCNFDHPDSIEGYGLTRMNAFKAIKILNTPILELYYK